jgi:Fe-S-cluster-containing dehydrogenase component/anaerobic selenocysteine-containing dehydrogenase
MKQDFVPLEAIANQTARPRYWTSLEDLAGVPRQPEAEEDWSEQGVEFDGRSRRRFLELMGASLGLAGLAGCTRQPTEFIVPYVDPPEQAIPGRPVYYATAVPVEGVAQGVIVETHLGRPTKVEGNPDHPGSLGASSVLSQASVLDLYDPDRAREITYLGEGRSWDEFLAALRGALEPLSARKGAGFRILSQTVCSPTLGAQIAAVLKALPEAKWHQFEPAGQHSARAASQLAFGRYLNAYRRLDSAEVVVALDSDFLAQGHGCTRLAHDFAVRRRQGKRLNMNRLYVVESEMTSTGGKADHRLPVRYAEVEQIVRELAAAVGVPGITSPGTPHAGWVSALSRDLLAHPGASAVIPGDHQSPAVHALAHSLNAQLGNVGKTIVHTESLEISPTDQIASLRELVNDMQAGEVEVLLILGGNPAYDAPVDLGFTDQLRKAKTVIHVSSHFNETSVLCNWHVPESHFFEDWGDARAFDGTLTVLQPLIEPLYDSHSFASVLDGVLQFPARSSYEIVRAFWTGQYKGKDFEVWWRKTVHDGFAAGSAFEEIHPALAVDWARVPATPARTGTELVFRPDPYMFDGSYANNTWLQELPHPMTKLTWDNAVHLSAATARRLGVENRDVVRLRYQGRSVNGAIWISPGHPDETITIHLGFGHTHLGRAADGSGFSAYALRTSNALWSGDGLGIEKTGHSYSLATVQPEQQMDGRNLILENTVGGYRSDPGFVERIQEPVPRDLTLYPAWQYPAHAWGMSIDLTACVNCNACVIACQAENNIPVVGKEQVLNRRAMHWIRIDTYYKGEPENPSVFYQPLPCMQCENAPCELVCPVQATNHSSDGLNDMVYNRCVGTRYCSNNCPYKVRRFNFLLFQDWATESIKLQRNPDVSVRSRGVMEKCTYCVQRIREAEIRSQDEDRSIRDGEIQTACQQACPTQAIVFGDINQRTSRVARLKDEKLNYALLAELNTRPRTTYLAELRNPNPGIVGGSKEGAER